jgi:cytochrome P450
MPVTTIQSSRFPPGPEAPLTIDIDLASQQAIAKLLNEYGDIVKLNDKKRKSLSYIVTNPDAIKHVLISNHSNYQKGAGFERVKMLLGNGIIVSDGKFWRRQRTMIQPAFSRKNIVRLCEMFKTETQGLVDRWKKIAASGDSIDITTEMSVFALQVILRALISDDLDLLIAEQGENPFNFLADDPTRDLAVAMKFRQLGKVIQKIIDTRREQSIRRHDLLDSLMNATDKSGDHMSDKELIDEVMTMIIAGHETSAGTLNWVWYELSQHPGADKKAWQEAEQYVHENTISTDDLPKLVYIKQCIDEALRLYPPVWLFSRKAINDDTIAGYTIPAGTNIFLSPYFTHRDPELWDHPDSFYPQHFIDDGAHLKHKYSFIPFSAGSRRCIGEYFSYVEMQTHLAIMLKTFKLDTIPGQTIELEPAINLRTKNSIMMQISLR